LEIDSCKCLNISAVLIESIIIIAGAIQRAFISTVLISVKQLITIKRILNFISCIIVSKIIFGLLERILFFFLLFGQL